MAAWDEASAGTVNRREDVRDLLLIVVKKRIYFLCRLRDGRKKLAPEHAQKARAKSRVAS